MKWAAMSTGERKDAVLALRTEGLAADAIAARLGASSRSVILGFVSRMKKSGVSVPESAFKVTAARKREQKLAKAAKAKKRKPTLAKAANGLILPIRHQVVPDLVSKERAAAFNRVAAFDPLPGTTPRPLAENTGCKWPVDGFDGKGLLCCGEPRPAGANYCQNHKAMSVQK